LGLLLKWKLGDTNTLTKALNILSFVLLIFPTYNIVTFIIQSGGTVDIEHASPLESIAITEAPQNDQAKPDIYYIIVDGYARSDLLTELFEYDNSAFIQYLQQRGFYVAERSRSNYVQTSLSLASSLNFEYLDYLTEAAGDTNRNRDPLADLIQQSQIRSFLEAQGYQTVTFATGYGPTTITDADIYIPYRPNIVSDLESMLLTSSALRALGDRMQNLFLPFSCEVQRGGIQNIFENLVQIPELDGSQFVFAHIMSPHPPFVFGSQGEAVQHGDCNGLDGDSFQGSRDDYRLGYSQQVAFISAQLESTIDQILAKSEVMPIIIIQADHGPGMLLNFDSAAETCLWERTAILNAYLLPEYDGAALYAEITPINTFRIVLDQYFGVDLPLLDDRIYFSTWDQLYQFEDITDRIEDRCDPNP